MESDEERSLIGIASCEEAHQSNQSRPSRGAKCINGLAAPCDCGNLGLRIKPRGNPMTWKGIVGLSYTADEFDTYCHGLNWTAWRPSFVTLHNTASPTLADRPNGLTKKHILNL